MKHQKVQYMSIDEYSVGQRLDNYLLKCLKNVPKTHIYRIIRKGEVRINKKRAKPAIRLQLGDVVRIPPIQLQEQQPIIRSSPTFIEQIRSRVLHDDQDMLIINKPAGLPVHGGTGSMSTVMGCVRALYPQLKYVELAHRLDKATSGCLVMAKKPSVLKYLHELLREGKVEKKYTALVKGHWQCDNTKVDKPLLKTQAGTGQRSVQVDSNGKHAVSYFTAERYFSEATLVSILLDTGRTHQIRVHAQSMQHPIAGDERYGDYEFNKQLTQLGLKRLFLHASGIQFKSYSQQLIKVEAPLDQALENILEKLA